jgi:four helix bundle protein
MKKIQRFEDIIAWQKAKELVVKVYMIMKDHRDYRFRDQFQSASVSIMNNIAEGYERIGDKQFKQFLYFAKGSCGEVRSMIHVALDLEIVSKEDGAYLYDLSMEISRLLSGFIKKLN